MKWQPRLLRNLFAIIHDTTMAGLSFVLALYMRWADEMWWHAEEYWWRGAILCSVILLGFVLITRLYRRLWRYVSLKDISTIVKISAASIAVFYALMFMTMRLEMLPRSVPLIHGMLLLSLLCAPRFLYRALHEKRLQLPTTQQVPVLLVGVTAEAELFIRESMRSPSFAYRVVGAVSTDDKHVGQSIHHVKVYGNITDIPAIIRKLRRKDSAPQRVIISDPQLDGTRIRDVLALADKEGVTLARMPKITDLTRGDKDKFEIKPIDVEDILGRPQARLDLDAMRAVVAGKVVLITGAGGSIGSELVRQIAGFAPKRIVLVENSEYNLYSIDREMAEDYAQIARKAVLADVRDADYIRQIFTEHQPHVVFHAAALKHVPLCEINIGEAILTNVVGTRHVADACVEHNVELMVQISTDKAVNPTNVMGACKRLAECYAQALGQDNPVTKFVTVRFGNVLGSTGSVVPLFQKQLEKGGPLTVTHKNMTRYFMTIREAVQLVIQAAALGCDKREQVAPIYVLDMGDPIRIEDLALQMIRLSGLRPHLDITIHYTGLRPGEKMHEELFYDNEELLQTEHEAIHLAQAQQHVLKTLAKKMDQLYKAAVRHDRDDVLAMLQAMVPEYDAESNPKPTIKQAS